MVMKGDKSLNKLVLHHYRLRNPPLDDPNAVLVNGPLLASFNPKQNTRFLLFLHRQSDGRYSPVSGQYDPAGFSIVKIDGLAQ
jgi:hypothetical protein